MPPRRGRGAASAPRPPPPSASSTSSGTSSGTSEPPAVIEYRLRYSWAMHLFHAWLVHVFGASTLACGAAVTTWAHFAWTAQLAFYGATYAAQLTRLPEIERQVLLGGLLPLHGALWCSFLLVPWRDDGNSAADGGCRDGGWRWPVAQLLLLYVFVACKSSHLAVAFGDWDKHLALETARLRETTRAPAWWAASLWTRSAGAQIASSLVLPLLWHVLVAPRAATVDGALDRTDWILYLRAAPLVAFVLVAGAPSVLFGLVLMSLGVTHVSPALWNDYYRDGVLLAETLDAARKPVVVVVTG